MSKFVFSNPRLQIDIAAGTLYNVSSYVKSLTLNYSKSEVDKTCMTDVGIARLSGLYDWSMDVEFAQDFATGTLDEAIFTAISSTVASFSVYFRPTEAAVSASNPSYRGEGLIFDYTPLTGSVGDLSTASISIRCAAVDVDNPAGWLRRSTST